MSFDKSVQRRHQLFPDKSILTPTISIRIYKTLQRSIFLYALEFCDWDVDQIRKIEVLQAKALRCHLDSDLQCPQSVLRLVSGVEPIEARRDFHVLLYYAKLYKSPRSSFLGLMHQYRSQNLHALNVGFYKSVYNTLIKYNIERYWNNIPDVTHEQLKPLLKKPIWAFHWKRDVTLASTKESPFSRTFVNHEYLPKPYKSNLFLDHFSAVNLPHCALSAALRFWLTPNRSRECSCSLQTNCLAKHLLFECRNTRNLFIDYLASLPVNLRVLLCQKEIYEFFSEIAKSKDLFEKFNSMIGQFEYPRY